MTLLNNQQFNSLNVKPMKHHTIYLWIAMKTWTINQDPICHHWTRSNLIHQSADNIYVWKMQIDDTENCSKEQIKHLFGAN
jgi:hypothetical protein